LDREQEIAKEALQAGNKASRFAVLATDPDPACVSALADDDDE
jgi:hypothetical protein